MAGDAEYEERKLMEDDMEWIQNVNTLAS
jgi:hypothetical protein